MSRTKKTKKAPGKEYWSARPGGREPGPDTKKQTHRIERKQNKQAVVDELKEKEDQ